MSNQIFKDLAPPFRKAGLWPTPVRGKAAVPEKWQKRPDDETFNGWVKRYGDCGIGLAPGSPSSKIPGLVVGLLDVDEDALVEAVERIIGFTTESLTPKRIGKKGAGYIVLTKPEHAKIRKFFRPNSTRPAIEMVNHLVLPPSIHPDTGRPYYWEGKSIQEWGDEPFLILTGWMLDEMQALVDDKYAHFTALNEMQWLGVGGGGGTHDICVAAVDSLVQRHWVNESIQARIKKAYKEASKRSGVPYDWPGADKAIDEWADSAREKHPPRAEASMIEFRPGRTLREILETDYPAIQSLVGNGVVPKVGLATLIGHPKTGKSLAMSSLTLARAADLPWLGFATIPGVSVVFQGEVSEASEQKRIETMIADRDIKPRADDIFIVSDRRIKLTDPRGFDFVRQCIGERRRDDDNMLVFFDTWHRYYEGNENDNKELGRFVDRLMHLIEEFQICIWLNGHPRKPSTKGEDEDGGITSRGGGALFGAVDSMMTFSRYKPKKKGPADPLAGETNLFVLKFELRDGPEQQPLLVRRTPDLWIELAEGHTPVHLLPVVSAAATPTTHNNLVVAIIESAKTAGDKGCSKDTAKRRIKEALGLGFITKDGDRYVARGPKVDF